MRTTVVSKNLLIIVASALLVTGCASTSEINEAKSAAERAMEAANRAVSMAEAAEAKAEQALREAQQAQMCCNENSEKMQRMLERNMSK